MKQVLGDGYKENDYYSGYLTVYNGRGESDVYTFSRDESNILKEAIEQDVKEGNFDAYQLPAVYKDEQESIYTNSLSLSYYGKGNGYQTWDYYYNYMDYRNMRNNNVMVGDASGSCYIQVGPKCVNTIRVLKKMASRSTSHTQGSSSLISTHICTIIMSLRRFRKIQVWQNK